MHERWSVPWNYIVLLILFYLLFKIVFNLTITSGIIRSKYGYILLFHKHMVL